MYHLLTCLLLAIAPLLAVTGCAPEPETRQTSGDVSPEPLSTPNSSMTPRPTGVEQSMTQVAVSARSFPDCASNLTGTPRHYKVNARLDWIAHTLHAEQYIEFFNSTGQQLDQIVLAVEPNQQPDQFTLRQVIDATKKPLSYVLDGSRLAIRIPGTLEPGCATALTLTYDLAIAPIRSGYQWGRLGYLGYTQRQYNLGMWLPLVAAYDPAEGWMTPPSSTTGEHFVLEVGDFDITLTVANAPDTIQVAGPGLLTHDGNSSWHLVLNDAREIALSLSTEFYRLNTTTPSGIDVQLFYFSSPSDNLDTPRHVLHSAADALTLFEDLYGPYPYDQLTIVQGDFPDGMEFSGLVFVSDDWFRAWLGIPNDWLTLITVHEVAHQWWYALVGSDQGRFPYLDEALALYSELLFLERYYPEHTTWWWDFRVASYAPQGMVDAPVTSFDNVRTYINAVYLRGALMLQAVRDTIGDTDFFTWLHAYAEHMAGQLANPADFWQCLPAEDYAATRQIRAEYFTQVEPVTVLYPIDIP